jgi:hypothetical protein
MVNAEASAVSIPRLMAFTINVSSMEFVLGDACRGWVSVDNPE